MHDTSSNDDVDPDPYSAADLMGAACWQSYIERWNPQRWVPDRAAAMSQSKRRQG
jgi:hypothetical protein